MSDYDRILLSSRWSEFETMARRHQAYAEARRALADNLTGSPMRAARVMASLRGQLRRSLKGRRSFE